LRKPRSVRDLIVTPPSGFQTSPLLADATPIVLNQAAPLENTPEQTPTPATPPPRRAAAAAQEPVTPAPVRAMMNLTPSTVLKRKPRQRERESSMELEQLHIGAGHFNNTVGTVTSATLAKQVDMRFRKSYSVNTAGSRSSREVRLDKTRRTWHAFRC